MLEIGPLKNSVAYCFRGLQLKAKNPFTHLVYGVCLLRFHQKHIFGKESSHCGGRVQGLLPGEREGLASLGLPSSSMSRDKGFVFFTCMCILGKTVSGADPQNAFHE